MLYELRIEVQELTDGGNYRFLRLHQCHANSARHGKRWPGDRAIETTLAPEVRVPLIS
jgi:hypothetical protein